MTAAGEQPSPNSPRPAPRRGRGWIWYFAVLVGLTIAATTIVIAYNWSQRLTPERLEAARKLWETKGPKDYEYRYTKRLAGSDRPDRFHVVVRGGRVESVTLNGTIQLPKRLLAYHTMERQLDYIESFLEMERKPDSPKVPTVARFDPTDGHLVRYIRGGSSSRERVSLSVEEFKPLDPKAERR
jgi:hypothetical protein